MYIYIHIYTMHRETVGPSTVDLEARVMKQQKLSIQGAKFETGPFYRRTRSTCGKAKN